MTSLLTKIKSLETQISTNTENISNKQDVLTAGNNITIDENNIISSSGGGSITQGDLDLKQDKLTAGTNITISASNVISSSDKTKQDILTYTSDLVINSIVVKPGVSKGNYIPAISGELKATTLTIEEPFTGETLNVKDTHELKQNILIAGSNITITNDTITSTGGITQENLDLKQDKLSAGTNITIDENNVIS